jgi:O-antigen/teichoic acid export membrane protein
VVPIIVINKLGAKNSAFFYVALSIASLLYVIPLAINRSLFAEGSNDESTLRDHVIKTVKLTSGLLLLGNLSLIILGRPILYIFGKSYAEASFKLLVLLALSSFFIAIIGVIGTVLNIKHKIIQMAVMNIICFLLVVVMCVISVGGGLLAVGKGWLLGQILASLTAITFYLVFVYLPKRRGLST